MPGFDVLCKGWQMKDTDAKPHQDLPLTIFAAVCPTKTKVRETSNVGEDDELDTFFPANDLSSYSCTRLKFFPSQSTIIIMI
jgi:hypothetical protein